MRDDLGLEKHNLGLDKYSGKYDDGKPGECCIRDCCSSAGWLGVGVLFPNAGWLWGFGKVGVLCLVPRCTDASIETL